MNAIARYVATSVLLASTACAVAPEESGSSSDEIVTTAETAVKNQSALGTCWIYTTTGWVESLVKHSYGYEAHYSESYLIYWDWFEKITNANIGAEGGKTWVDTEGGTFGRGVELIRRYGLMKDGDLLPGLSPEQISQHQAAAKAAMKDELTTGSLSTEASRKNPRTVRAALNAAWGFTDNGVADHLDLVFGAGAVTMRLDVAYNKAHLPKSLPMWRAQDIEVKVIDPDTKKEIASHLDAAIGTATNGDINKRSGRYAWNWVPFPAAADQQRAFFRRMQVALGDGIALPIVWQVPIDAMQAKIIGPGKTGRYGGHLTLISDYEAMNVPGFGTLKAGQNASAAAQQAALSDAAKIKFVRIKNSWGGGSGVVPNSWWPPAGYYDLYASFLTTPVQACDGVDKDHLVNCASRLPLSGVAFPAAH